MSIVNTVIPVEAEKCRMVGPYKCPYCGGHMCYDTDYLEANAHPICPYCYLVVKIPPYERSKL